MWEEDSPGRCSLHILQLLFYPQTPLYFHLTMTAFLSLFTLQYSVKGKCSYLHAESYTESELHKAASWTLRKAVYGPSEGELKQRLPPSVQLFLRRHSEVGHLHFPHNASCQVTWIMSPLKWRHCPRDRHELFVVFEKDLDAAIERCICVLTLHKSLYF